MGKKAHIRETALRLFVDRGFHGTPTSMIAEKAGIATGTLFYHYKTKEELINDVYAHIKKELFAHIQTVKPEGEFEGFAKQIWEKIVVFYVENPEVYEFLDQFYHSKLITEETRQAAMTMFDPYKKHLAGAIANGEMQDRSVELICQLFSETTTVAARNILMQPKDQKKIMKETFSFLWNGLKK